MIFGYYLLGILGHVAFKWARGMRKGVSPFEFWRSQGGPTVASAIAAVFAFGLFYMDPLFGYQLPFRVPTHPFGAAAVGFALDSLARGVWEMVATLARKAGIKGDEAEVEAVAILTDPETGKVTEVAGTLKETPKEG